MIWCNRTGAFALIRPLLLLTCLWVLNISWATGSLAAPAATVFDFYGRPVTFLKLFGQRGWSDCSPGRVDGTKIYHAAGVVVDRSVSPNIIYVADTGNNRILAFNGYGHPKADLIFGQPDEHSGAPNGDCNLGSHRKPTAASLALLNVPENTNLAEQWMRLSFDVDRHGNLYIPDTYNNRVLVYNAPFSADRSGGKGDTLPDRVIGQVDYESNGINSGMGPGLANASSLYISFGIGFDHVASRGVSVDPAGNVWVADTFNSRVLRFPPGASTADLVLGQPDFSDTTPANGESPAAAPLHQMHTPTVARIDPDTGELYVVDEYPNGFRDRILIFKPPFRNGMSAERLLSPKQPLIGDYAEGYRLTHVTGLVFNPVKTDDWIDPANPTYRYSDGVVWLHDADRTMLLDRDGNILVAMNTTSLGIRANTYQVYADSGLNPEEPFNLIWPGGMIGFDSQNNIYLADEHSHRIARYALPYRYRQFPGRLGVAKPNGGLFPGIYEIPNVVSPANFSGPNYGAITWGNQLIVRDLWRYLVWNDYRSKPDGAPADLIIGQENGASAVRNNIYGRSTHTIDDRGRLWAASAHGKLLVYQLPFTAGAQPLREVIPLYWSDNPAQEVDYHCDQPLAFDRTNRALWVFDNAHHRLLRVRNPDEFQQKLLVDAVIGQPDKVSGSVNRGKDHPDAASFGDVNDLKFDHLGNLFVVDNTYELHHNGRILAFLAADLRAISTMFPPIQARRVYVATGFDQPVDKRIPPPGQTPFSPVSIAFNGRNEMVVGNDGYFQDPATRHLNQLYLYRRPLEKATPDAVIELPLGAPGELSFDEQNNLVVQDHTWSKLWVLNFERDPSWLRTLDTDGAGPAVPSDLRPVEVTTNSVRLAWTDRSSNETEFRIERAIGYGAFQQIAVVGANETWFGDASVAANEVYSYRVRAFNSGGASDYSNTAVVETPAAAPGAPMLTGSLATAISVELHWQLVTGATGYRVERQVGGGSWTLLQSVAPPQTAWTDTELAPETTYSYRVQATNAGGASPYSNVVTLRPLAPAPLSPTDLSVTSASPTGVLLSWTDRSNNETGFEIERRTPSTVFTRLALVAEDTQGYLDTSVAANGDYLYRVRAVGTGGNSGYSNEVSAGTQVVLASLSATPARVKGGRTVRMTVTLNGPAPPEGASISLTSSSSLVRVPSSLQITSGGSQTTYSIKTHKPRKATSVQLTASYRGTTRYATVWITR